MARFYGMRIKAGEMKLEDVPKLWRQKTEKWLQENLKEGYEGGIKSGRRVFNEAGSRRIRIR